MKRYILICRSFMSLRWSILQRLQWRFHSQQTTILLMTETWTMHICFSYLQMACITIRSHSYFSSLIWKLSGIDFAYHRCKFSAEISFYFERKDQEIVFIQLYCCTFLWIPSILGTIHKLSWGLANHGVPKKPIYFILYDMVNKKKISGVIYGWFLMDHPFL